MTTNALSCGWWRRQASSSMNPITGLSIRAIFGVYPVSWMFWTIRRYVLHAFLEKLEVALPLTFILMSPKGGLGHSFSLRAGCLWGCSIPSLLMNLYNFPCLIRASICCFKSWHSDVSWPWSRWKWQYLSLYCLMGSPFNLPGNVNALLPLIYIRTWSINVFRGVKLVNLSVRGLEYLSSLLSPVLAIFRPLSCQVSSCLSLFRLFFLSQ